MSDRVENFAKNMPMSVQKRSKRKRASSETSSIPPRIIKSQSDTSDGSTNQSFKARASEDSPLQAPAQSIPPFLQQGNVVSSNSDEPTPFKSLTLQASSQSSQPGSDHNNTTIQVPSQFHLRDLPAELRRMIYSHVWPCYNNSRALLTVLRHDSKLSLGDLEEALKFREQNQNFTVTIKDFKAFKAMRMITEQINHITIQKDWADTTIKDSSDDRWSTLSGCHCTLRNYFETIRIHIKQEASQYRLVGGVGVELARILIRAGQFGNGGPTKLFITVEALEPLTSDLKK